MGDENSQKETAKCSEAFTDLTKPAPDLSTCSDEELNKAHNAGDVYNYKRGQPMIADVIGYDGVPYVLPCPSVKELAKSAVGFKLENKSVDPAMVLGQCNANYTAAKISTKSSSYLPNH